MRRQQQKPARFLTTDSKSVGWSSSSAFAGTQDDEISSAEVCTGASAAPDSQSLEEEDEVMTDDLMSVSERDPCLGPAKVEQKRWACRPHQLVIDAPAQTSAANDKTPARTFCPGWAFSLASWMSLRDQAFCSPCHAFAVEHYQLGVFRISWTFAAC